METHKSNITENGPDEGLTPTTPSGKPMLTLPSMRENSFSCLCLCRCERNNTHWWMQRSTLISSFIKSVWYNTTLSRHFRTISVKRWGLNAVSSQQQPSKFTLGCCWKQLKFTDWCSTETLVVFWWLIPTEAFSHDLMKMRSMFTDKNWVRSHHLLLLHYPLLPIN